MMGKRRLLWRLIIAMPSRSPFLSKYAVDPLMSVNIMVIGVRIRSSSCSARARASSNSWILSLSTEANYNKLSEAQWNGLTGLVKEINGSRGGSAKKDKLHAVTTTLRKVGEKQFRTGYRGAFVDR